MLMRCIAPNLWGWLGDRSGQRLAIVRFGAVCTALGFSPIFLGHSYAWLALIMAGHAFFWHAVLPQFEVITLAHLRGRTASYSRIRLWGSIGFICTVVGLGALFERLSLDVYPLALLAIMLGIVRRSWWVPNAQPARREPRDGAGGFLQQLRQPGVLAFYLCVCLMQLSHGPYYTFLTLHLESLGYSRGLIGLLWALGVVAEVMLFLAMPRLLQRFSLRQVLVASFLLASLRWLLLGTLAGQPAGAAVCPVAACGHLRQLPRRRHPFRAAQLRPSPAGAGPGAVRRAGRHRWRAGRAVLRLQLEQPGPCLDLRHRQPGSLAGCRHHLDPFERGTGMNDTREQLTQQIIEAGRFLYGRGWSPATSSNYSARLAADRALLTVSGKHKGQLG